MGTAEKKRRDKSPDPGRQQSPELWKIVLLLAITVLAYTSALNGGYIWDDDSYVTANRNLRSVDGLASIWAHPHSSPQYYPLVFTTFWLEYHAWGLNPFGYHLDNVLLHVCVACLLYLLLLSLEVPGAWFAALIFAVHPVNVETTAWITERKNLLSGFFYMLAAIALFRFYRLDKRPAETQDKRPLAYAAGLIFFICALLSKTTTSTLPVAVLLILWWKRGRIPLRDSLYLTPFFVVGGGMGLLTVWLEKTHVGAKGADWGLSFAERFLVAGKALCFYAWKLIWPVRLSFQYERWVIDGTIWYQYLYPLAVVVALLMLWMVRRRTGRGPLTAALFFAVSLFPALGFFDVFPFRYSYVADHFQYLASIGPITLFVGLAFWYVTKYHRERLRLLMVLALLVALALSGKTWAQGKTYTDAMTLWNATVRNNPNAFLAQSHICVILMQQGKFQEALPHCDRAIEINSRIPEFHSNRGNIYVKLGDYARAISDYDRSLELAPNWFDAYNGRGLAYAKLGDHRRALLDYSKAIELNPVYKIAYYNRGAEHISLGNIGQALSDYDRVIQIDPGDATAYVQRGLAYAKLDESQKAIADYDRAVKVDPSRADAYNYRGFAYATTGDFAQAVRDFDKAIEIHPGFAQAYNNRGFAYIQLHDFRRAISDLSRAIEIDGEYAAAYNNLGYARAALGDHGQAIGDYDKAIAINPAFASAYYNRAVSHGRLGNRKGALEDYKRAAKIDPEFARQRNPVSQ